jgi:enterochelin esterase-like enzyme
MRVIRRWSVSGPGTGLVILWLAASACAVAPAPTQISPSRVPEPYVPSATPTSIPPTPSATPSNSPEPTDVVCDETKGHVLETSYQGAILPGEIPVRVYLPPCYDRLTDDFPSVILLHGKPFTETHWQDLGVVDVVDEGIQQGDWPPFIMIMPLQPEPLFSETDGGPGSYEAELTQGLLPYVEATFRTKPDTPDRAIAGISRGGVWALEIGFLHPDVFGEVAGLSPALAVNYARPTYDPLKIAQLGSATLPRRIFLGAGEVDWARAKTQALAETLAAHGATPEVQIVAGDHVSATWQALMPAMFRYLTADWGYPSP